MPERRVSVTMVAPCRQRCGVADYTAHLVEEMAPYADVKHIVGPADFHPAEESADLVHIQHQYFLFGGVAPWKNRFAAFAKLIRRPAVMTVHEFVAPSGKPHVRAAIRLTNRLQFARPNIACLLVHTGEDRRRMAAERLGKDRIEVVRHGVPPPPEMPNREEAKRALGLDGRFVITLFGFLSRKKGHGLALEAAGGLPDNAVLLLAGGRHPDDMSDYPEMIMRMIESERLSQRACITGYLSDEEIPRVMAATDVILAPFTETSGSGSLAMAFACGRAILASDIAAHREIEQDALRLVPSTPDAWSRAVEDLMRSPEKRAALEAGARRYAATHTYGHMARETVEIYRYVLGGSGR